MSEAFEKLGIIQPLAAALQKAGIETPTLIQEKVIPLALLGKDIVGQSATGTGKTLAYLLPLMQKLDTEKREMQAFILAPTHELASQINRTIEETAKNSGLPVTSALIIGNVNIARQIDKLKEKPHVIVGSSGRILELIQKKKISSQTIKTIIIDEADRLLDENNIVSVKAVIKTTMRDRQMLMFSATINKSALERIKELMNQPEIIKAEGQIDVPADISHMYFVTDQRDKIELLRKLLVHLKVDQALVFINKSDNIEIMTEKLNYHGLKAAGLHGDAKKLGRKTALEDFRKGKIQLLVASDLAARGLDIPGISHIFNLDLPEDPQVYLHRVGRTGRAGQSGSAVSLITANEVPVIQKFAKILKIDIAAKHTARGKVFDARGRRNS